MSHKDALPLLKNKLPTRFIWLFIVAALLYFALRNAPLLNIWKTLKQIHLWQIILLIIINIIIYGLITLRWWIIVRAEKKTLPYLPMILVRVAVFGVSYFTLGPQVGGEPLQVLYLQRRHGLTYTRAASTVVMDKLLEFLANFILLAVGLTAMLQAGILSTNGSRLLVSLSGLVILMLLPPLHIAMLYRNRHPLSAILRALPKSKLTRFISASEKLAGIFCRRHLSSLVGAALVSLLAGVCLLTEFALLTVFLQIHLSLWQIIAAWTAGWLSFLVPVPAGVGALEAAEVFAFGALGVSAVSAISVTLLIRARDLLFGGLGLLFASRGVDK